MNFLTKIILLIGIVIGIRILAWVWAHGSKGKEKLEFPYFKKRYFISKAELLFFKILEQAIEGNYYIFPQVRLSDLIYVKTSKGEYQKYRNKINRKSVDFVIVEKDNLNPLLAIELDDRSHNYKNRIERDDFVKNVFEKAGLPLLRIKCAATYDTQEIKAHIKDYLLGEKK